MNKDTESLNPIVWSSPKNMNYSLIEIGDNFMTIYYGSRKAACNRIKDALWQQFKGGALTTIEEHNRDFPSNRFHEGESQDRIYHIHFQFNPVFHRKTFDEFVEITLKLCETHFEVNNLLSSYHDFLESNPSFSTKLTF